METDGMKKRFMVENRENHSNLWHQDRLPEDVTSELKSQG